jgi:Exostosin family
VLCACRLGKLYSTAFAQSYQGNYWGNHRMGLDIGKVMRARMHASYRRVDKPEEADLFFIPLDAYDTCYARSQQVQTVNQECGINYTSYGAVPNMWRWLLKQPSFQKSDGSDHFVFAEQPLPYLKRKVRRPLLAQ